MNRTCYKTSSLQQGMALVLVLWVLTLLTIMAGSFALSIRREASVISSVRDSAEASAVARAGVIIAQKMLLNPDKNERWLANGTVYPVEYAGTEIRIKIVSEQGKINLNKAKKKLLENMIKYFDDEDDRAVKIADAILDWRDTNDLVRLHGAETAQYQDENLKYVPRNKPFQSIEELQLVLGVDQELYKNLEPLITIYSKNGNVDKNTASETVLAILEGQTQEQQEKKQKETEIKDEQDELSTLFDPKKNKLNTTTQGAFTIFSEAKLENGAKSMIKTIIRRMSPPIKGKPPFLVSSWSRLYSSDESLFEAEEEQ